MCECSAQHFWPARSSLHQLLPRAMPPPPPPPRRGGAARWAAQHGPQPRLPSPNREQTRSVCTHRGAFSGTGPRPPSSSSPSTPGPSIAGLCGAGAGAGSGGTAGGSGHVTPTSVCSASGSPRDGHPCLHPPLAGCDGTSLSLSLSPQTWTSCCRTCGPSCSSWTGKASAPRRGPRRNPWPISSPGCRAPRVSAGLRVRGQGGPRLAPAGWQGRGGGAGL